MIKANARRLITVPYWVHLQEEDCDIFEWAVTLSRSDRKEATAEVHAQRAVDRLDFQIDEACKDPSEYSLRAGGYGWTGHVDERFMVRLDLCKFRELPTPAARRVVIEREIRHIVREWIINEYGGDPDAKT